MIGKMTKHACRINDEIRMTKPGGMTNDQMTKDPTGKFLQYSDLVLLSSFDIRASSFFSKLLGRLHESEKYRDWDRYVTDKKQPGENPATKRQARIQLFIVQAQGLE